MDVGAVELCIYPPLPHETQVYQQFGQIVVRGAVNITMGYIPESDMTYCDPGHIFSSSTNT